MSEPATTTSSVPQWRSRAAEARTAASRSATADRRLVPAPRRLEPQVVDLGPQGGLGGKGGPGVVEVVHGGAARGAGPLGLDVDGAGHRGRIYRAPVGGARPVGLPSTGRVGPWTCTQSRCRSGDVDPDPLVQFGRWFDDAARVDGGPGGHGRGLGRRRRPAVGADGAAEGVGGGRVRVPLQLRQPQGTGADRATRWPPCSSTGSPGVARSASRVRSSAPAPRSRTPTSPPAPGAPRSGPTPRSRAAVVAGRDELDATGPGPRGRVRRPAGAPTGRVGRAAGPAPTPTSSGRTAATGSTTDSATRRRPRAGPSSASSPETVGVPSEATAPVPVDEPDSRPPLYVLGMADDATLVTDRTGQLLDELDPGSTPVEVVPGPPVRARAGLGLLPRGVRRPRPPSRPAAGGGPAPGRGRGHAPRCPRVLRV